MQQDGQVLIENLNRISHVTFSHPKHNSMPLSQLQKLKDAIIKADEDDSTKVILLKSAGDRTFCAGANFDELVSIQDQDSGTAFFKGFAGVILAMSRAKKLVVGRVQGKAVGGGVGLLAATDFCFATQRSSIRLSELSIGIGPYVIEPAISRKIGKAHFSELVLTPRQWKSAAWSLEKGLFQRVFENIEQMDQHLSQYLLEISNYSSEALSNVKKLLWEKTEDWPSLLDKRAALSASLLLKEHTQRLLRKISSK